MKSFIPVCVLLSLLALASGNYCTKSLCQPGRKHIGCQNNGRLARECAGNNVIINFTQQHKDDIVHLHNEKRNKVAGGNVAPYQPADRMATMTWDDELAYLAGLNVKTCVYGHDACRNTATFAYSGQNLAFWGGYPAITVEKEIESAINLWYQEHKNADMRVIKSYHSSENPKKPNGHFTVMVADRNIKVGCAMRKAIEGKYTKFFFACNYATTNMMEHPIYVASRRPGSGCKSGRNPKYPALCSPSEQYDVNKWF